MLEDAAPAVVPACRMKACGWISSKLRTFLVLTRRCNEVTQTLLDDGDTMAEQIIVRTDSTENAVRRCIRTGMIPARGRLVSVQELRKDAFIPISVLDRPLTDEEMQTVIDVNQEMLGAGVPA
jgi:hypothetical protein